MSQARKAAHLKLKNSPPPASRENNDIELNDKLKIDFTYDYSEDIKAAQTQVEMNISSKWFFVIWDTELNNLWNRFYNSADQQTKKKILEEQRNRIAMKEEVTL